MAAPAWFNKQYYIANKIAELKADGYGDYTPLSLAAAMKEAGYSTTDDGYYQHFLDHGKAENVSPTPYFDPNYYFQSKAASYFGKDISLVTESEVLFIKSAFQKANLSAWDHYLKYGMSEGIDPSADFSTEKYLTAKLAQLNELDPDTYGSWTISDVANAFTEVGLTAFEHYFKYGQSEGLTISPADHGYVVQSLTSDIDNLSGTLGYPDVDDNGDLTINDEYSDYFLSEVGTLQSADVVDGLKGDDTFYARVVGDPTNDGSAGSKSGTALEPTIKNVETILFRSEVPSESSAGYVNYGSNNKVVSYIDADRFELADGNDLTLGSDNSRADLSIEDVRHNSNETIIRFADADPGVNYWVYFDPQHLTAESAKQQGSLFIELMDVFSAGSGKGVLETNPYNNFAFAYNHDGTTEIIALDLTVANREYYTGSTATYDTLVEAFNIAIAAQNLSDIFTAVKGSTYTATAISSTDGKTYSHEGNYVVLSATSGTVDCNDTEQTGWAASGRIPPDSNYDTRVTTASSATCPLIEVRIELDNVGRVDWDDDSECLPDDIINGSNAGDLQVGSMALRGGIERMDVLVDRGSWLNALYSTNDTLRMVTVTASDINGDGFAGNTADETGQLYIGAWEGNLDDNGNTSVNNTTRYKHLTWTDPAKLLTADDTITGSLNTPTGLKDVAVFDATGYEGDINIAAAITEDSYDKYLKSVDGVKYIDKMFAPLASESYNGQFSYITGSGDDVVNMTVAGDIAADVDFKLAINTSDGADLIALRYGDMSTAQSLNQKYLQNVTINAGSGDDTTWFYANDKMGAYFYNEPQFTFTSVDLTKYEVSAITDTETIKSYTYTEELYQYENSGAIVNYYKQPDGTYRDDSGEVVDLPSGAVSTGLTRVTVYERNNDGNYVNVNDETDVLDTTSENIGDYEPTYANDVYYFCNDGNFRMADGTEFEGVDGDIQVVSKYFIKTSDGSYVNIDDSTEVLASDVIGEDEDAVSAIESQATYAYDISNDQYVNTAESSEVLTTELVDATGETPVTVDVAYRDGYYVEVTNEDVDTYNQLNYNDVENYLSYSRTVTTHYKSADDAPTYAQATLDYKESTIDQPGGSAQINGEDGADVIYANQFEFFTGGAGDENGVTHGSDNYNAVFTFNTYRHNDYDNYPDAHKIGIDGFDGATLNNDIATGLATFTLSQNSEAIAAKASHLYVTVNYNGFVAASEITGLALNTSSGETSPTFKVDGKNYLTAEQINHAVIDAIENDTTAMNGHALSDLLSAKDGSGHSLLIESKINGPIDEDAISIGLEFRNPTSTSYDSYDATATFDSFYDPHYALAEDGSEYDGDISVTTSQVTVNGGAGNDLIVLGNNHHDDLESVGRDVVTLTTSFGNDTIIDFMPSEDYIAVGNILSYRATDVAGTSLTAGSAYVFDSNAATQTQIQALVGGTLRFAYSEDSSSKALVFLHQDAEAEVYTTALLTKSTAKDSTTEANATVTVLGSLTFADGAITNDQLHDSLVSSIGLVDSDDLSA